jgi:hypothetical protein
VILVLRFARLNADDLSSLQSIGSIIDIDLLPDLINEPPKVFARGRPVTSLIPFVY